MTIAQDIKSFYRPTMPILPAKSKLLGSPLKFFGIIFSIISGDCKRKSVSCIHFDPFWVKGSLQSYFLPLENKPKLILDFFGIFFGITSCLSVAFILIPFELGVLAELSLTDWVETKFDFKFLWNPFWDHFRWFIKEVCLLLPFGSLLS